LQAYSPYRNTEWQQQWRESKTGNLERQFKTIISTLEQQSSQIVGLVNEEARLAEIQRQKRELEWQRWKIEEAERKRLRDIKESKADLLAIIEAWAEAKRIESFFEEVESRTLTFDQEEPSAIINRLAEARELLGGFDALERLKAWKTPKER
jgi:spore coat polysaccharide biosynthesis predicted glycosyltransferase SpsG